MEPLMAGELVTVAAGGPELDGIVFDTPSRDKVVVAVVDRARGPVLRTVPRKALAGRDAEGDADPALRLLIRRTPPPHHGGMRPEAGGGIGRAGHARRAAGHRTTGK